MRRRRPGAVGPMCDGGPLPRGRPPASQPRRAPKRKDKSLAYIIAMILLAAAMLAIMGPVCPIVAPGGLKGDLCPPG